jgi:hypothetical protein
MRTAVLYLSSTQGVVTNPSSIGVEIYFRVRGSLTAQDKGRTFNQLTSAFWQTLNLSGPQSWAMEKSP